MLPLNAVVVRAFIFEPGKYILNLRYLRCYTLLGVREFSFHSLSLFCLCCTSVSNDNKGSIDIA